ncbi:MAG TPA: sigma-70 family RNA polymerase sigma factor [Acidimicrobiales bacterium]|nr:sigma-70 family RNA polymerase sigma factor [Acidimicrobiales bacterium]
MTAPSGADAAGSLDRLVRTEGRAVLATLVRTTGRLDLAEDAVQEAVLRALETWPRDGVPDHPRAWLTTVARNRAVDIVRREARRDHKEEEAVRMLDDDGSSDWADAQDEHDLLRLVFTCCHPTLSLDAQVALSLRTLCGLTTPEVATALLVPEATMTKRLTRARKKIAVANISYRVPDDHELPDRLAGVAATVYLVFNAGYSEPPVAPPGRDAAVEALELAQTLHGLMPDEPSVIGLLALVLLQQARRGGRFDADGVAIPLAHQDRSGWDRAMIEQGVVLVGDGLRRTPDRADPYVVQAAVAACHALAPTWAATDWEAVVSWYDVLLAVHDTPVVRLNRAAALAERDGPALGLEAVDAVAGLEAYPFWCASRAELLARLGRDEEARAAWAAARRLGLPEANDRWVERRMDALGR